MKKGSKRCVIWDLDGTLWHHKKGEIALIAENLDIPFTKRLEEQFFCMLGEFNHQFANIKVSRKPICELIEKHMPELFCFNVTGEQFLYAWNHTDTNILNEQAVLVLEETCSRGIKNIVLTDWLLDRQLRLMKQFDILKYMERIYSCENYYMKRNPKSISRVILPEREEQYVIVGDSLTSDIAFANNAGIESIWYNRKAQENDTQFIPTYETKHLKEVLEYI